MSEGASQETTREKILAAATEIFAAKGFLRATVREICAKAKVNLALVNYHFESKEKLYEAVVEQRTSLRKPKISIPRSLN